MTPHDALFKAGFELPASAAGLFQRALPASIVSAIAWSELERESGSFVDPELAGRHSDLLFRTTTLRGEPVLLYLLVEHQSTNDPDMTLRVLIYLARILERFRKENEHSPLPLVLPVVVAHAPEGWTVPISFHAMFSPSPTSLPGLADLVPRFDLVVLDLSTLSNDEIEALSLAAFPKLVLWALRDARRKDRLSRDFERWRGAFIEAMRTAQGQAALRQLLWYFHEVVDELYLRELHAKIRDVPAAEEFMMTYNDRLRAEGRAEGHAAGRAEGLELGQRELLRKLLVQKYGDIPEALDRRIEGASLTFPRRSIAASRARASTSSRATRCSCSPHRRSTRCLRSYGTLSTW
jgi:predicted transposase/invertase (TIGR01784 family)